MICYSSDRTWIHSTAMLLEELHFFSPVWHSVKFFSLTYFFFVDSVTLLENEVLHLVVLIAFSVENAKEEM